MYTPVWNKYLPVLRILFKRAIEQDQTFNLNLVDFHKTGPAKKTTHKFNMEFINGKLKNASAQPGIARELAAVFTQDPVVSDLLKRNDYNVTMNTKIQLGIHVIPKPEEKEQTVEHTSDSHS